VRIAVLNNLRAGRSNAEVSRVLSLLRSYPDVLHIETDRAHALPEALLEIARQNVNLLVVNGGDGTLQFALTEILAGDDFERIPMIAPLRGGRTNMTALDLGARRNPVKGLRGLLEDARAGRLAERIVHRPVG
jgi:diacylglycerol kinase family enzyme